MFDSPETSSTVPASVQLCVPLEDKNENPESQQEEATVEDFVNDIHMEHNVEDETCISLRSPKSNIIKQKRWRPAYVSQIDIDHAFDTPRRAKRNFGIVVSKLNALKKKVVNLNQKNRRLTKKVEHLQSLLKLLKDRKLISEEAEMTIQVYCM